MLRWKQPQNQQEDESAQRDAKVIELKDAIEPLSGASKLYCTDACLRRYLENRNWNVQKAKKMLQDTLKWRSTFKPHEIRWHEIASAAKTGTVSRAEFHDRNGRSALLFQPAKRIPTIKVDIEIRQFVYIIENAILNLPEDQEQVVWLIDFTEWSMGATPPIKTVREVINIIQNYYPETLAVSFLYNPPRVFEAFWKIVKYFLDNRTSQRMNFVYPKNKDSVELMLSYFDVEKLPIQFGGKANWQYDHEEFSKLMIQDDKRTAEAWSLDNNNLGHIANGFNRRGGSEPLLFDINPKP